MKAIDIIKHIEMDCLNYAHYATFRYRDPELETPAEFVSHYFGGDFLAGSIKLETDYIAFWEDNQPRCVPDAIVSDIAGIKIYIYEIE